MNSCNDKDYETIVFKMFYKPNQKKFKYEMAHDQNPRTATVTILNKSWVKNTEPSTHYVLHDIFSGVNFFILLYLAFGGLG